MAVSADLMSDFIKGSVGLSKMIENDTLLPSMRMSSATIPELTMSLPVPG